MTSPFKSRTGILGSTEPGQKVTPENMHFLPPGSVVRNGDGSIIIHLHDDLWLRHSSCSWHYDTCNEMYFYLDPTSVLCHIP